MSFVPGTHFYETKDKIVVENTRNRRQIRFLLLVCFVAEDSSQDNDMAQEEFAGLFALQDKVRRGTQVPRRVYPCLTCGGRAHRTLPFTWTKSSAGATVRAAGTRKWAEQQQIKLRPTMQIQTLRRVL